MSIRNRDGNATLTKIYSLENPRLDALAESVLETHAEFDARLGTRGQPTLAAEIESI